jgi:hypothetical protein
MKTHHSNVDYTKKMAQKIQGLTSFPPAIPFEKTTEKKSDSKDDKDKYKVFEIKIDKADKESSTIEQNVKIFEQGTPEQYVQWLEDYRELEAAMPLKKPEQKVNVIRSILKGSYLETFNNCVGDKPDNKDVTDNKVENNGWNILHPETS